MWSPATFRFEVFDRANPQRHATAKGRQADSELWIAGDGAAVVEVRGTGVTVMGARMYSRGQPLVSPPAIRLWRETKEACTIVLSGSSRNGHIFDVIVANAALTMLVTGFETYCQTRFRELDLEGVEPSHAALLRAFGSVEERRQLAAGATPAILDEEPDPTQQLIMRINFQSYECCKRAWNRGYGIKFGDAVENDLLGRIQRLLTYRHRIIHVSPLIEMLNGPETPPEDPEFSSPSFAAEATSAFGRFIEALHRANPLAQTLTLATYMPRTQSER